MMRVGATSAPSSSMVRLSGGMEPGEIPPTSAWCAREAVKNSTRVPPSSKTGETTVMSGRWVPPAYGEFTR